MSRAGRVLLVAIDCAARWLYVSPKDRKGDKESVEFIDKVFKYYKYTIHTVITDNGEEFTDSFCRDKKHSSDKNLFDRVCGKRGDGTSVHSIEYIKNKWTNRMIQG